MKSAFKYQGLGNDFVMLDWMDQPYREALNYLETPSWVKQVQELTNRDTGIGADGVIVILKGPGVPAVQGLIYNKDGSYASFCGNGARCVADYLHHKCGFPNTFNIIMGTRVVECRHETLNSSSSAITTLVPAGDYLGTETLQIDDQSFVAHKIDVGNPHLVILQPITLSWLEKHGTSLEYYFGKEHRYNIEFVWPAETASTFHMLVHERGAGITQACGSGAMASALALLQTGQIQTNQKFTMQMLGGKAIVWVNENKEIALHAGSQPIPISGKQLNHDTLADNMLKSML